MDIKRKLLLIIILTLILFIIQSGTSKAYRENSQFKIKPTQAIETFAFLFKMRNNKFMKLA